VAVQLPLGLEDEHHGVIDLITMKAMEFQDDSLGAKFEIIDIPRPSRPTPKPHASACSRRRPRSMTPSWSATSRATPTSAPEDHLRHPQGHPRVQKLVPVLTGSAFKNKGVQQLLDAVVNYLPSPLDVPPIQGVDPDDPEKVLTGRPRTTPPSPRWPSRSSTTPT
jgi:elongation factor G